ncbi:hypothetical protein MMC10_002856 [Thelotrema lepadinum]|nr:hypothetical protein [Thelotrema lepadinum]
MPLTIHTIGTCTLTRHPELAILRLDIHSSGSSPGAVSQEVQDTSASIQSILQPLAPPTDSFTTSATVAFTSPEATLPAETTPFSTSTSTCPDPKPTSSSYPVTSYSTTSFTTSSHSDWNSGKKKRKIYTASSTFSITFADFTVLGKVVADLSTIPNVSVRNIDWRLTLPTRAELEAEARKGALRDALVKAEEYAGVLGWSKEAWKGKGKVVDVNDAEQEMSGGVVGRMSGIKLASMEDHAGGVQFVPRGMEVDAAVRVRFEA